MNLKKITNIRNILKMFDFGSSHRISSGRNTYYILKYAKYLNYDEILRNLYDKMTFLIPFLMSLNDFALKFFVFYVNSFYNKENCLGYHRRVISNRFLFHRKFDEFLFWPVFTKHSYPNMSLSQH